MHARRLSLILLFGCASSGATTEPAAVTTPAEDSVPMTDARRALHALPDPLPEGDLDAWWDTASLALEAYRDPCAFPDDRRAIDARLELAHSAFERERRAQARRGELADADETPEALQRARDLNEAERAAAAVEVQIRLGDLAAAWGQWSYACVRLITEGFERNDDDMRALACLEDELERISRAY